MFSISCLGIFLPFVVLFLSQFHNLLLFLFPVAWIIFSLPFSLSFLFFPDAWITFSSILSFLVILTQYLNLPQLWCLLLRPSLLTRSFLNLCDKQTFVFHIDFHASAPKFPFSLLMKVFFLFGSSSIMPQPHFWLATKEGLLTIMIEIFWCQDNWSNLVFIERMGEFKLSKKYHH